MLVLTRKKDEEIIIGQTITVQVLEFSRDRVTLGISAPLEIPIHRKEVHARIAGGEDSPLPPAQRGFVACAAPTEKTPAIGLGRVRKARKRHEPVVTL